MEVHNEASLSSGLNSEKGMYLSYMISRAFIPPWSLVMRDRKLLDQTLPVKAAGTLVSPSARSYDLAAAKSRKFCLHSSNHTLPLCSSELTTRTCYPDNPFRTTQAGRSSIQASSQTRKPPRKACVLSPRRTCSGRRFSFVALPPPSTT